MFACTACISYPVSLPLWRPLLIHEVPYFEFLNCYVKLFTILNRYSYVLLSVLRQYQLVTENVNYYGQKIYTEWKSNSFRSSKKVGILKICSDWFHHQGENESASTSETSVNVYQTTRCNNPEDSHLLEYVVSSSNGVLLLSLLNRMHLVPA
jgi:hypothetical protein